jgi:hypothetical protein
MTEQLEPATASRLEIVLSSGGVAYLISTDGDKTAIASPEPAPPGATVCGYVTGCATEFQLKVRNCIKKGDVFMIDGRLRNITRPLKAVLLGKAS